MTIKQKYFTFLIALFITIFTNGNGQKKSMDCSLINKINFDKLIEKTIKLNYDFEIKVGQKEDYETFETYSLFILTHNSKQIFIDTFLSEYVFEDKLYPFVRQLDNESFEILVEINDRPNKNYLKYFRVFQDKIVSVKKMPTFISALSNLDKDKDLEFAGFWDWGETWGENYSLTAYNPIIYYELRKSGIVLDSTLTIAKNKEIYGDFHGFNYNENIEIKTSETKKRQIEIERIIKNK